MYRTLRMNFVSVNEHFINKFIIIIIFYFLSLIFRFLLFYHVLLSVIPTPWTHMVCWMSCPVTYSGFIDSTFLRMCAVPRIADLCRL